MHCVSHFAFANTVDYLKGILPLKERTIERLSGPIDRFQYPKSMQVNASLRTP